MRICYCLWIHLSCYYSPLSYVWMMVGNLVSAVLELYVRETLPIVPMFRDWPPCVFPEPRCKFALVLSIQLCWVFPLAIFGSVLQREALCSCILVSTYIWIIAKSSQNQQYYLQLDCSSVWHGDPCHNFCWRGPILNLRPFLDSSGQTTSAIVLDFFS